MVWDLWKQAQQDAWKLCLWLEKTLTALHPWAQPCCGLLGLLGLLLHPAGPQNAKKAKGMLGDHPHRALFSFQRAEQC